MADTTFEPLLSTEDTWNLLREPGVTTISFFNGGDHSKSVEQFKEKVKKIVLSNPWIAGRLVRKNKKLCLAIPTTITETHLENLVCTQAASLSTIHSDVSYKTLCRLIGKTDVVVKSGYKIIGKSDFVSKFTLLQVANDQLAMFLSISHTVADGHTYYKIMNVLSSGEIEVLNPERKHEYVPKSVAAVGEKEHKMVFSSALMCDVIGGMLCDGPKAIAQARHVDMEKIQMAKAQASARAPGEGDDPFVCSTNDVITSSFGKATNSCIMMMAFNLRGRLENINADDAGNYLSVIPYDAAGFETPEAIRASLQQGGAFARKGKGKLPSFWKLSRARISLITSWAFPAFKADLHYYDKHGNANIPLHLHLPIINIDQVPFPIAVVFKPSFGKLAVLYLGSFRALSLEKLNAIGAPLGDNVSEAMFDE
jgi:hypothetical protein